MLCWRSWYVPAEQNTHSPPSGPEKPALQVQAVAMKLPTGELEFDGQVSHVADPGSVLKVPALQDVHAPPLGPVDPLLQVQAVETELPNEESAFVGHVTQVDD